MVVGILVVVMVVDLGGVVLIEVVIVVGISEEGIVSVTAFLILFSVVVSSVAEVGLQWSWITGSGFRTRSKNFKTPFFSRYQKFLSWGNSNGSKTTPKIFSIFFFNKYGR